MMPLIVLLLLLQTKHFVLDFIYQPAWQWKNKGTYGHWGGIAHSGQHGVASFFILLFFVSPILALMISLVEFVAHYHIDWAKMSLNRKMGWASNTHNEFWILTGFDQYLHQLTYVVMLLIVVKP